MLQFIWIITDTLKETKLKYCFNQWWPSIKNSSLFSLFINHSQTTCIKIIGGFFINEGWSISRRTLVRMATLRGGHLKEGILQYYTENYFRTLIMQGGGCWVEVHSFTVPLKTRWPLNWWLLIKSSFGVAAMPDWNYTKDKNVQLFSKTDYKRLLWMQLHLPVSGELISLFTKIDILSLQLTVFED